MWPGLIPISFPRSRFLDDTPRSSKRTPPKVSFGERCVTSKKRLRGKLDSIGGLRMQLFLALAKRFFSRYSLSSFALPPKKSGNEDAPWNLIFNDLYFIYYPRASFTTLFSAWRNCYMKGKNPYGTLAHRASHYIYFHFIIYLN